VTEAIANAAISVIIVDISGGGAATKAGYPHRQPGNPKSILAEEARN